MKAVLMLFTMLVLVLGLVLFVGTMQGQTQNLTRDPYLPVQPHVKHSVHAVPTGVLMLRRLDYASPLLKANPHARLTICGRYRDVTNAREYMIGLGVPSKQMALEIRDTPFTLTLLDK